MASCSLMRTDDTSPIPLTGFKRTHTIRRPARRGDGDPHPQDRAEVLRHHLQPARQGIPDDRRARARDARGPHQVLVDRPGAEDRRVQAGHPGRAAALPRHARGGHRPTRPLSAQRLREGRSAGASVDAAAVEERLQHGHQRAAGRLEDLHSGVHQGRADLDRRFALPPGQRRGEPHRPGVLLQGDRAPADRAQGHEARMAAPRDAHPLDHHRLRRGPQQGDGERHARGGEFPRRAENGADEQGRSLPARLGGGRLPRVAGGRHPQGRALHDPEEHLHQEVVRAAALVLALAMAAPGHASSLQVVTTSADLKSLAEAVGGGRVEAHSLAAPDQDPHAIELKPAQLARLRDAALLVRIGLDHEPWLARVKVDCPVVDASQGVRLLQTETPRLRAERQAHSHAYGNPHYWLDPQNARPMTASILEALSRLSPTDRPYFEANRNAFLLKLDTRMKNWTARLAPLRDTKVVVIHDSWSYFAERFGLAIVAAAEPTPGVPPSPAELAKLFARMREAGVKLVIADPYSNPSLVRQISAQTGARSVTLLPSGDDYLGLFDENAKRLTQ